MKDTDYQGYLSDRELETFLQENIAAKWFCGFNIGEKTPDHTVFSRARTRIRTKIVGFQRCEHHTKEYFPRRIKELDTLVFARTNLRHLCRHLYLMLREFLYLQDNCIQNSKKHPFN